MVKEATMSKLMCDRFPIKWLMSVFNFGWLRIWYPWLAFRDSRLVLLAGTWKY